MGRNRLLSILTLLTILASTCFEAASRNRSSEWDRKADIRKADVMFLEALRVRALDRHDATFELTSSSYRLNPDDKYVGWLYGSFLMAESDSAKVADGYRLMRRYIDSDEGRGDFYAVYSFAIASQQTGRTDDALEILRRLYHDFPDRQELGMTYASMLSNNIRRPEDRAEVLSLLDTIERRDGMSIELTARKVQLYVDAGDTATARTEIHRLPASNPGNMLYNIVAAELLGELGDTAEVTTYYNRAVELDPSAGLPRFYLANYYLSRGDSVAYNREMTQALKLPDVPVEEKLDLIRAYIGSDAENETHLDSIAALFDIIVEQHPHEAAVHSLYFQFKMMRGDYAGAISQARAQLEMDPGDETRWVQIAQLLLMQGAPVEAERTAAEGLHFYPRNMDLVVVRATADGQAGRVDEAMSAILAAMDSVADPKVLSRLYTAAGDILYEAERTDSAFIYYRKAIDTDPGNTTAMNNCAYFMACNDTDLDYALSLIEKVVAARPDDPTSLDTYAWVLFKRKDYAKAREIIDLVLDKEDDPGAELLEHAGDIYFWDREPEQALDFWKRALAQDPENELLERKVKQKTYFYE